jgi:hypothetical protein
MSGIVVNTRALVLHRCARKLRLQDSCTWCGAVQLVVAAEGSNHAWVTSLAELAGDFEILL